MWVHDLTLGIARGACMRRWGFTDLSRLLGRDRSRPGQCSYPTRNFAQFSLASFLAGWTLSWCSSIHLLGDTSDPSDTDLRQMLVLLHQPKHVSELLEIDALLGLERMLFEEWNDAFDQLLALPHSIGHPIAMVLANHAATEIRLDRVEELRIAFVLYDGELGQDLVSHRHAFMSRDTDMEAALTIHEACDPFRVEIHGSPRTYSL
jgi:hypothetical protein